MLVQTMPLIMRQEVREYLRASAKLFGLAFQENALTEAEREAIVSYAQELAARFSLSGQQANQPSNQAVMRPALTHDTQPPKETAI